MLLDIYSGRGGEGGESQPEPQPTDSVEMSSHEAGGNGRAPGSFSSSVLSSHGLRGSPGGSWLPEERVSVLRWLCIELWR